MYPCCLAIHCNAMCCHSLCRPFVLCLCNKPLGGLNRLKYLLCTACLCPSPPLCAAVDEWFVFSQRYQRSLYWTNQYSALHCYTDCRHIITCISTKRETFLRRLNRMSSQQDLGLFNLNSILFGKLQCLYISHNFSQINIFFILLFRLL